jgi:uncharacterized membrane protein
MGDWIARTVRTLAMVLGVAAVTAGSGFDPLVAILATTAVYLFRKGGHTDVGALGQAVAVAGMVASLATVVLMFRGADTARLLEAAEKQCDYENPTFACDVLEAYQGRIFSLDEH